MTPGSLFGYTSEQVSLQEGNETTADGVYLLKVDSNQNGSNDDFSFYYHDGEIWRSEDDPDKTIRRIPW